MWQVTTSKIPLLVFLSFLLVFHEGDFASLLLVVWWMTSHLASRSDDLGFISFRCVLYDVTIQAFLHFCMFFQIFVVPGARNWRDTNAATSCRDARRDSVREEKEKLGRAPCGDFLLMACAVLLVNNFVAKWQILWSIPKILIVVKKYEVSRTIALGELSKQEFQYCAWRDPILNRYISVVILTVIVINGLSC